MGPTTEVSQRQHEQIQMQVKKHIPRYPNPLIFAFVHFKKPEAKANMSKSNFCDFLFFI